MKNKLMHVYGQYVQHDEVLIVGNKERLLELKLAIERALIEGEGKCESTVTDGEWFDTYVIMLDDKKVWENMALPYSADYLQDPQVKATGPWELLKRHKIDKT